MVPSSLRRLIIETIESVNSIAAEAGELYERSIDELEESWDTAREMLDSEGEFEAIQYMLDEIEAAYGGDEGFAEELRDALYDAVSEGLT